MVKAVKNALLVTCDVPLKTFLVWKNERQSEKFIQQEIDDTHLLITDDGAMRDKLYEWLTKWHDENSYAPAEEFLDIDEEDLLA
jgi:hypothetical protein